MRKPHALQVASSINLVACPFTELPATTGKHSYHPGGSLDSLCWFHLNNKFVSFQF